MPELVDMAVLKGKSVLYGDLDNGDTVIVKDNYNFKHITNDSFEALFYRITDEFAALKEDCIDYVIFDPFQPLFMYPKWFIQAYHDGWLFEEDADHWIYYDTEGDTSMAPGAVMLHNRLGDIRYMERENFDRYYDIYSNIEHDKRWEAKQ